MNLKCAWCKHEIKGTIYTNREVRLGNQPLQNFHSHCFKPFWEYEQRRRQQDDLTRRALSALRRPSFNGAMIALMLLASPAFGHSFYESWSRNDGKGSCCNDNDCAPAQAKRVGENWQVFHNGTWLIVPEKAVLDKPSPDGNAHACVISNTVVCFVEPILV